MFHVRAGRAALLPALLVALLGAAAGCQTETLTAPTLAHGSMSATIDGAPWVATSSLSATFDGTVLTITGSNGKTQLSLSIASDAGDALARGTYAINTSSASNATFTAGVNGTSPTVLVAGGIAGSGGGPVDLSSLSTLISPGTAAGSFAIVFAATRVNGAVSVTNGTFSVVF